MCHPYINYPERFLFSVSVISNSFQSSYGLYVPSPASFSRTCSLSVVLVHAPGRTSCHCANRMVPWRQGAEHIRPLMVEIGVPLSALACATAFRHSCHRDQSICHVMDIPSPCPHTPRASPLYRPQGEPTPRDRRPLGDCCSLGRTHKGRREMP